MQQSHFKSLILIILCDGLQNEKTGDIVISENVSGDVPFTDLRGCLQSLIFSRACLSIRSLT
jgi:hypothetical protein